MAPAYRIAYGIGTAWYKGTPGEIDRKLVDAIKTAVGVGYRHIDCAQVYGNEAECGIALQELSSTVPRSDLWITTKYNPVTDVTPYDALKESLKKLQLEKVDEYLIHTPAKTSQPGHFSLESMWTSMEQCQSAGLTDHIGVSNYKIPHLEQTRKVASLPIYANQIECHPYHPQSDLLDYCAKHKIIVESYCPLAPLTHKTDGPLTHQGTLDDLAKKYGKTTGQVLLAWNAQRGSVVITTSSKESRMKELLDTKSLTLSPEEMKSIDSIGGQLQYCKYDRV